MAVINTNVNALLSQHALKRNEQEMTIAMERLSTGKALTVRKTMQPELGDKPTDDVSDSRSGSGGEECW